MSALLLLRGGHKTFLAEITVSQVVHALEAARLKNQSYIFFQAPNLGDNGYAVDPEQVVAVTKGRDSDY